MGEAWLLEKQAIVAEITRELGDDVTAQSDPWWQYVFVVTEIGDEGARQLVREVRAVEAAGGVPTQDGSRRRTAGGVFFALAYERIGPNRTKSVRWRASRRVQEDMIGRFLRLLALALPGYPGLDAVSTEAAAPPRASAATPASAPAAAKPARRPEPEAVEVLVVRRRPAGGGGPGTSTPRAGR